jgi:hypothetical protein
MNARAQRSVRYEHPLRPTSDDRDYARDVDMTERPPRTPANADDPPNLTLTVLGVVDMFTMSAAGTMHHTLADGRSWFVSTPDGKYYQPS